MPNTHYPPQWIERLCAILNVHGWATGNFPHEVVRFLTAMGKAEGGTAKWNPLNSTTHVYAGTDRNGAAWQGVDYNTSHVCNYRSPTQGVMATAATLLNGNFNKLVGELQGALESGITAEQITVKHADEIRTWGTNPTVILKVLESLP